MLSPRRNRKHESPADPPKKSGPAEAPAGSEPQAETADSTAGEEADAGGGSEFGSGREPSSEELAELRAQAARSEELFGQLQRTSADLKNLQKRLYREKESARKLAVRNLLQALLPSCDNLERALRSDESTVEALRDGVRLTWEEIQRVIADQGVLPVDPEPGTMLDPNVHEAVVRVPSPGIPENAIAQVLERGYVLDELVIRPARVTVSAGEPEEVSPADGSEGETGADEDRDSTRGE
jgi:molecular chaperone GrpE